MAFEETFLFGTTTLVGASVAAKRDDLFSHQRMFQFTDNSVTSNINLIGCSHIKSFHFRAIAYFPCSGEVVSI